MAYFNDVGVTGPYQSEEKKNKKFHLCLSTRHASISGVWFIFFGTPEPL